MEEIATFRTIFLQSFLLSPIQSGPFAPASHLCTRSMPLDPPHIMHITQTFAPASCLGSLIPALPVPTIIVADTPGKAHIKTGTEFISGLYCCDLVEEILVSTSVEIHGATSMVCHGAHSASRSPSPQGFRGTSDHQRHEGDDTKNLQHGIRESR